EIGVVGGKVRVGLEVVYPGVGCQEAVFIERGKFNFRAVIVITPRHFLPSHLDNFRSMFPPNPLNPNSHPHPHHGHDESSHLEVGNFRSMFPNPHHYDYDESMNRQVDNFSSMFPPNPFINPNPHHVDDEVSINRKIDELISTIPEILRTATRTTRKFMDVKSLCNDLALGYVRSNTGKDYEFVDFASYLIPTFSRAYGDGLHFNFFARQKTTAPPYHPAELFFVEVANGDPQTIIRCVPLLDQPYALGDEDRPAECIVFHPDGEFCVYCDHAKDGSLERNFCLAPPLM
ncbi:hypothetical protein KSS87_000476, partial [Heliosperma pusillum]